MSKYDALYPEFTTSQVDAIILNGLRAIEAHPVYAEMFRHTGMLMTEESRVTAPESECAGWDIAVAGMLDAHPEWPPYRELTYWDLAVGNFIPGIGPPLDKTIVAFASEFASKSSRFKTANTNKLLRS